MKTIHPDDQSIQQFIFDKDHCDKNIARHINACQICQKMVAGYQELSTDFKAQEVPVLDFNLEDRVLRQITTQLEREKRSNRYFFAGPIVFIIIGIVAILSYIFIGEMKYSFGIEDLSIGFIICVGLLIVTLFSMDMMATYKSKMNKIDFS